MWVRVAQIGERVLYGRSEKRSRSSEGVTCSWQRAAISRILLLRTSARGTRHAALIGGYIQHV